MEEEIELADFFSTLWQKKKIIIITIVAFAIVALIGTTIIENINKKKSQIIQETPTLYYAQTTFLVATYENTTTTYGEQITTTSPIDVTSTTKNYSDFYSIKTYNEIVKSKTILNTVKKKLNLTEDLADTISVVRVSDSNLVAIIVSNSDKEKAIKIANSLTEEFVKTMSNTYFIDKVSIIDNAYLLSDKDLAKFFKDYIIGLARSGKDLSTLLADLDLTDIIPTAHLQNIFKEYIITDNSIQKLNVASTISNILGIASENQSSKTIKYTIFSAILGLVTSCGLIIIIEMFNPTIKNKSHMGDNILALVEYNGTKNIFDILRIKLEKNKLMLITSPKSSNQHSYISNNLAMAFSNMNKKTLLIDLTSNETTLIENANKQGLFDFIKDKSGKIDNYISKVNNLDLLLAGDEIPSCLEDEALEDMISTIEKNYDYVIINTNNILENSNSLQLAKSVKNTILIATQRKTTLEDFERSKEIVAEVDGKVLGTILLK